MTHRLLLCAALVLAACAGSQSSSQTTPSATDTMKTAGASAADSAKTAGTAAVDAAKSTGKAAASGAASAASGAADAAKTAAQGAVDSAKQAVSEFKLPAIELDALDTTVAPCDDFYQFACGSWLKKNEIPGDRASWGRSFSVIQKRNEELIHSILDDAAKGVNDPENPFSKKVGDFYATCMDEQKAETGSLDFVKQQFKAVDAIKDTKALAKELATLHQAGNGALFAFGSEQDLKDATQVIGAFDQGGLGLPDREFYLDPARKDVRDAYQANVEKLLALAGDKAAKKSAATVMKIETQLAQASMKREDRRDPKAVYHRIEKAGLVKTAPHFPWDVYLGQAGQKDLTTIDVNVPAFYQEVDKLVANKANLAALKTYLKWHVLLSNVPLLGKQFVDTSFEFTRMLTGQKEIRPRWKRCVQMTDGALGEAVGRTFVNKAFGGNSKPLALDLINRIEDAFRANLATLDWMDEGAKKEALLKIHNMMNKIGYPDKWRDYTTMEVGTTSLAENHANAAAFERKRDLAKIGKPVDRAEWLMTPPQVNAYANPSLDEMVFPAGILQPPFFSAEAPPSANHGGIGMVMGHELTHHFDDQGRQFDSNGNLRDWWSPASSKAYDEKAQCVVDQYNGYDAVPGTKLNGKLTLGENIADIGGLKLTYMAFMKSREGKPALPSVGQYGPEQQLFIAFAQTWCTNYRPESAKLQAQTNEHSTAQWRVNGPVSDNPDFARVFQCKAGSKMAPEKRCVVW